MNNKYKIEPVFSVIVNCRNSERFLEPCLVSIQNQIFSDFEVIIWNNVSTDKTEMIAKEITELDSRFNLFSGTQALNLGAARNMAIQKATGKYITFLDSDDLWHPNFLLHHSMILTEHNGKIFGCGNTKEIDSNFQLSQQESYLSQNNDYVAPFYMFNKLLKGNSIYMSSLVVPRSFFTSNPAFKSEYVQAEDYEIILRISKEMKCYKIGMAYYRIHEGNKTNDQQEQLYVETIEILRNYKGKVMALLSMELAIGRYYKFLKNQDSRNRIKKLKKLKINIFQLVFGIIFEIALNAKKRLGSRLFS